MTKMKISLYDSYQGKRREFVPLDENEVDIYYCGPTVYNYVHLGNFRPTITLDLLTRFRDECGYQVKCVSNYTDIDDKIIKEAKKEGKSEKDLSEFYIKAYEDCLDQLHILPLYDHPKASQYINIRASFIKDLVDKGYAYQADDDIYFRVNKIKDYGTLSKQNIDDLVAGSRIDVNSHKENPLDFALWKLTKDDGIKFDTVVGTGRPGWHTECVVMVNSVFHKPLIDIHGGGFDLKFPHHENEIAQSEASHNTHLANYWRHVGFLLTNGTKRSKSLGNSILAKDVLARHSGNAVRRFFYSTHYRAPINYTEEQLDLFDKKANKFASARKRASCTLQLNNVEKKPVIESDYNEFMSSLANDLNVSNARAVVDKDIKERNSLLRKKPLDLEKLSSIFETLNKFFSILGLIFETPVVSEEDKARYNDYRKAREEKDFATSDKLRPILRQKGLL